MDDRYLIWWTLVVLAYNLFLVLVACVAKYILTGGIHILKIFVEIDVILLLIWLALELIIVTGD